MFSQILRRIDSRGYKAYRDLLGKRERIGDFEMEFVRIQGDPFASPSVLSARVRFEGEKYGRCTLGMEDFLYRRLHRELARRSARVGEGKGGFLGVPKPKNAMLRRSAVLIKNGEVEFRFWIGLPARHRRVLAGEAERMLYEVVPDALGRVMNFSAEAMRNHVKTCEIQDDLRKKLPGMSLVGFVANGSILPRKCGDCEEPLEDAVPFESPKSLEVEIETVHGEVRGMGIRRGITVIAGTAFHGKSTLLNAIRDGIYNHVPGDGREGVVTIRDSFKVRAEDGRPVRCVDISTFIYDLPDSRDTRCFTTDNASGATSMAATIQESVEADANLLLVDEDTSATNLLFYDERTSRFFRHKTVSTVVEKARDMASKGISLIMVSSGSEPIVEIADELIIMEDYRPRHVEMGEKKGFENYSFPAPRILIKAPRVEKAKVHGSWITSKSLSRSIRIESDEHILEESQMILLSKHLEKIGAYEGMEFSRIAADIDENFNFARIFGPRYGPNLAEVRGIDFVYVINRIPEISVTQRR